MPLNAVLFAHQRAHGVFGLLCLAVVSAQAPVKAQTSIFTHGPNTTVIAPSGVTTINRVGNGYTVVGPQGVTTVNRVANNDTIVGPRGVTSVFSNGSGSYTLIGNSNVVPLVPNGLDGFTVIGSGRPSGEVLPAGNERWLLIGD